MEKRTHESYKRHAQVAEITGDACFGVKGSSVLLSLFYFDIITFFLVDYMHAICLGVVRTTTNLWLNSPNFTKPFYLGTRVNEMDEKLLGLKLPTEINRTPRSLTHRKYWKASEWRTWLLYTSPVVLKDILPSPYFTNWLLLVVLIHNLLSDVISAEFLQNFRSLAIEFVSNYQELYGKECMVFNVHQVLHLVDCVENWGPLWGFSAFPFEDMNGHLLKLFHGSQSVNWQIAEKYILTVSIPYIGGDHNLFNKCNWLKEYYCSLLHRYALKQKCLTIARDLCIGKGVLKIFDEPLNFENIDASIERGFQYKRIIVNGVTHCPTVNFSRRVSRRNDAYCKSKTGNAYQIQACFTVCINNCVINCDCPRTMCLLVKKTESSVR